MSRNYRLLTCVTCGSEFTCYATRTGKALSKDCLSAMKDGICECDICYFKVGVKFGEYEACNTKFVSVWKQRV